MSPANFPGQKWFGDLKCAKTLIFLDFQLKGVFWRGAKTLRRVNFLRDFLVLAKAKSTFWNGKKQAFGRSRKALLLHNVEGAEMYRPSEDSRGLHLIFANNDGCSIPQPLARIL